MLTKEQIADWFKELQDNICRSLEKLDGKATFEQDLWERENGGGGRTRVIRDGNVLEKGGVNFSAVHGDTPEKILNALKLEKADFFATGVSIVLHPQSPHLPIIHMNVRYFEMSNGVKWFGGGIDLTPHYIVDEDAQFFHQQLKNTCDQFDEGYYQKFKNWADDYFFIPHRNETRGIGGIFFDRLVPTEDKSLEDIFEFVKAVGNTFAPTYCELAKRHLTDEVLEEHTTWQSLRRSRYVEFNLVYDKGTKFGLDTNGRTESILMSMPPIAQWEYNYQALKGSAEERTLSLLKKGVEWV